MAGRRLVRRRALRIEQNPRRPLYVFTLTGEEVTTNTLSKLRVAGAIMNAMIIIEDGGVKSVSASSMTDSSIWVGFTPDDEDNPFGGGTFVPDLKLGSVTVKSKDQGFVNSFIASAIVGKINLGSVNMDNLGDPFGVLAGQTISSVTVKVPRFKWNPSGANDQSLGDFHVSH